MQSNLGNCNCGRAYLVVLEAAFNNRLRPSLLPSDSVKMSGRMMVETSRP